MKRLLALAGFAPLLVAAPASAYTDVQVRFGGSLSVIVCDEGGCREFDNGTVDIRQVGSISATAFVNCPIAQPEPGGWPLNCRPTFGVVVDPRCPVGPTTLCPATFDSNDYTGLVTIPQDPIPAVVDRVVDRLPTDPRPVVEGFTYHLPQDPVPVLVAGVRAVLDEHGPCRPQAGC